MDEAEAFGLSVSMEKTSKDLLIKSGLRLVEKDKNYCKYFTEFLSEIYQNKETVSEFL